MKDRYTDAELLYSAGARCACGAGLAYPLDHADAQEIAAWVCSRVLRGEVQIADGQSGGGIFTAVERADTAGQRHEARPFAFFEVKSEGQPSSGGATTRPAGSHVESEPHCTCRVCGHGYVAARRRNDARRDNEGLDCPACGAEYLNPDKSLGGRITVRSRTVVVADDGSTEAATPPPAPTPRLTAEELDAIIADCERCPFDATSDAPEARPWRHLHRVALELRDLRHVHARAAR